MPPTGLGTVGFRCCSGIGALPSAEPTPIEHDSVFRWLHEFPLQISSDKAREDPLKARYLNCLQCRIPPP